MPEAQVSCRPGYVAGDAIAGELVISVVLEEIFLVHDVSLGKLDGTVLRKRVKEGHGEDKLHDTGQVKVNVRSVTSNGEKLPLPPWDLTFRAGDGAVCDALEGAVLTMRKGDEAMLRVLDAAACSGLVASQLETPIVVHLAVLSVEKVPEKWDLSHAERLDFATRRKELSAELFRRGRTRLAASRYEAIASYVARPEDFKELQPQAAELRRQAWLNQAACLLLLSDHGRVKELCDKVLQEEPQQPKALFRRAKAQLGLAQHQAAAGDLQRLLEIEPQNLPGRQLLKEAKQELRRQDRQTAATFERMVKSLGSLPERERKDDDLVEAPDLDAEYEKLAQQTGVPLNRLKP
ncbi:unnamed protein product [Effrenium voratum]|uniref:peptidylprolyl isomerase n=1 Tax=Effrenium voratum TaxID=2562239 RepID=A0AA36IBV5_9DINO|nr:unnamed protein product [Effrenium voratum]